MFTDEVGCSVVGEINHTSAVGKIDPYTNSNRVCHEFKSTIQVAYILIQF